MLIGISPRRENNKMFVREKYLELLKNYGFSTILLTSLNHAILRECDGFLLPGGDDINPSLYNEENTLSQGIDDEIDLFDWSIIAYAVKKKKPLLAICRGLQCINVFFDGSLSQHINSHYANHSIKLKPPFLLNEAIVNSYHHQAIKTLGNNLVVIAYCEFIEGIIHQSLPIIAVQWHPELLLDDTTKQLMTHYLSFFSNVRQQVS